MWEQGLRGISIFPSYVVWHLISGDDYSNLLTEFKWVMEVSWMAFALWFQNCFTLLMWLMWIKKSTGLFACSHLWRGNVTLWLRETHFFNQNATMLPWHEWRDFTMNYKLVFLPEWLRLTASPLGPNFGNWYCYSEKVYGNKWLPISLVNHIGSQKGFSFLNCKDFACLKISNWCYQYSYTKL